MLYFKFYSVVEAWNEWSNHFNGEYKQYVGCFQGIEDFDEHLKIKNQFFSEINKFREWHGVNYLNKNAEVKQKIYIYILITN